MYSSRGGSVGSDTYDISLFFSSSYSTAMVPDAILLFSPVVRYARTY